MDSTIFTKGSTLKNSLLYAYGIKEPDLNSIETTVEQVFNYANNKQSIKSKYSKGELESNNNEANIDFIKECTEIIVPEAFDTKAKSTVNYQINKLWEIRQYKTITDFFSNNVRKIINSELNAPFFNNKTVYYKNNLDFEVRNISVRVFAVAKSLNNKVINISPYILNCNWNSNQEGGNFSFTVASPTTKIKDGNWTKCNETTNIWNNELNITVSDSVNFISDLIGGGFGTNRYNNFFFEKVLQTNDIVFIRGERLLFENTETNIDTEEYCDVNDLKGKTWDMIGLVDEISLNQNNASGSVTITIAGRDMIKTLIDDHKIIFPEHIAADGTQEIGTYRTNYIANDNEAQKSNSYKRLVGEIMDINLVVGQSLPRLISWVFDVLANIQITTNPDLFKSFAENKEFISFEENQNKDRERIGVWNLTEVFIDKSIKNRYLQDSSLSTDSTNLFGYIKKLCEPSLVEFLTDTYGDKFYWMFRQPPFDYEGYRKNLNTDFQIIKDFQVLNFNVNMSGENFYSVYRFVPSFSCYGDTDSGRFMFPAIVLGEIADLFGIKVMEIESPYIPGATVNFGKDQALEDLRFFIESHVYLPFTRKGTITIIGDRRFRKGMNCYFEGTDEMFYITGVSNQFSVQGNGIERVTVLNVERGVVLRNYDNYYNIVDFLIQKNYTNDLDLDRNTRGWKINKEMFEFFLNKKQFDNDNFYSVYLPNKINYDHVEFIPDNIA
jgi:hypothetical protein